MKSVGALGARSNSLIDPRTHPRTWIKEAGRTSVGSKWDFLKTGRGGGRAPPPLVPASLTR